jgi:signal transduction histidine kinase
MLPALLVAGFGVILCIYDLRAGLAGILAGALLIAEALDGRPRLARTTAAVALVALSSTIVPLTPNPASPLFFLVAVALPGTRNRRATIGWTALLCLVFVSIGALRIALGIATFSGPRLAFNLTLITASALTGFVIARSQRLFVQQRDLLAAKVRELHQSNLELAHAYEALAAASRQRDEFLAIVSHEVRQPVVTIATIAEAVADASGLDERERRLLLGLRQQARGLSRFAEDVLAVALLESGPFVPTRVVLDLSEFVANVILQHPSHAQIDCDAGSAPVLVLADPERLGQAIDNLVANGIKYSPPGAKVRVRVTAAEGRARLIVQDDGVGLDPTEIPRLFQKYSRVANPRTSQIKGVGLGLYLTRLIVEAHEGRVTAQSAGLGRGATFTIDLPLAENLEDSSGNE